MSDSKRQSPGEVLCSIRTDERGATAIMVALMLAMLIGFAALAIDLGYTFLARNELQNIADAAALAATRQLGHNYETMTIPDQRSYVCTEADIDAVATAVGEANSAAGKSITLSMQDVTIGRWDSTTKTVTATLNQPDAVKVVARRDESTNGPISTFFARIFNVETINVTASATAALTPQRTGVAYFPVAISKHRFSSAYCSQGIKFYPTKDPASCGGWHTYLENPASASKLSTILQALNTHSYTVPEIIAGETQFNFTGGTLGSAFSDMETLFNTMKVLNDGVYDHDEDPNQWTTTVAVYNSIDCANPSGPMTIMGFAEVRITQVLSTPDKVITAVIECDSIGPGRGGGEAFGRKGSVPGLVQ